MKTGDIVFHGSVVMLASAKGRPIGATKRRLRLERNPFREPIPGLLSETPEDQRRWTGRARAFLRACYAEAKDRLGEDKARTLFDEAVPKRRRGHQKGKTGRSGLFPDLPARLLAAYDRLAQSASSVSAKAGIPRQLAARLHADENGTQYGASVDAIERHLRHLLKHRKEQAAEHAKKSQELIDAYKAQFGEDLTGTLLSGADRK